MKLCVVLALLLSATSCRKDNPPPLDTCAGDGFGGCDGETWDGKEFSKLPSELLNSFIMPDRAQAVAFLAWCYKVDPKAMEKFIIPIQARFEKIREQKIMAQIEANSSTL